MDIVNVMTYTVRVGIATTIERDGKTEELDETDLVARAEELRRELDETGFAGVIEAAAKATAEDQFLRLRPVVDVESGA
jgi:hypothetical protein